MSEGECPSFSAPHQGILRGKAVPTCLARAVALHILVRNRAIRLPFSQTFTQWYLLTTSIPFLSDLEDYSDSVLASQL